MEDALSHCALFQHLSEEQIGRLLELATLRRTFFVRSEVIFEEGEICEAIGLILKGRVQVKNSFESGREVSLVELKKGDVFGEALLFGTEPRLPATVEALEDCEVLFLNRRDLLEGLFFHPIVLGNFIGLLSDKIFTLNHKLKLLGQESIEKKIAFFLLDFEEDEFTCPMSREAMARYLAVLRPSLSRELSRLRREGIIDYKKNRFHLLQREALEECLRK